MPRMIAAVRIDVAGNQIEPALKALKKQMLRDGIFQEMKRRAFYEKPSVKRKRKAAQARKRQRKALKRATASADWDRG
jgi:small subunit ribosomal protein S21